MSSDDGWWLLIGFALGATLAAVGAWFWARRRIAAARHEGGAAREPEIVALGRDLDAARRERETQVGDLGRRLDQSASELAALRAAHQQTETRNAELGARLQEQQHAAAQRYRDLESAREQLKSEFQALAAQILDDKARRFDEVQQAQLGQLLNPLREQLGDFRRAVSDAYEKENNARVALQTRIDDLVRLNQTLGQEAQSLSRALSADNRAQGYWGELKLERLLEAAGLEKGQQYFTQESFRNADGDTYRPDALLALPGDRHIIVDAKMTLVDYQRACETSDEVERDQHLGRHVVALRTHVRQLGEKDYSRLEGIHAPDLVLMFVPVEGAFLEALRRDQSIYEYAFERKIILVGPSNLLASLRLVAQIWRNEQQNRNAHAIAERAATLYDKFVGFVDDLAKVGEALERAQSMHRNALSKLAQGRGNLVRQAEMLRGLGVAPSKQLPAGMVDLAGAAGSGDEE